MQPVRPEGQPMPRVVVEFFGIPRQRAGVPELAVEAATAGDALQAVAGRGLPDALTADGRLSPHYLLSVNGERFVTNLGERLPPGTRLLLLSADAGG
jgi:molybdopterin converting factor small subunit